MTYIAEESKAILWPISLDMQNRFSYIQLTPEASSYLLADTGLLLLANLSFGS
jgi:hypothetical protein